MIRSTTGDTWSVVPGAPVQEVLGSVNGVLVGSTSNWTANGSYSVVSISEDGENWTTVYTSEPGTVFQDLVLGGVAP